jgi:hypothetical protein
MGLAENTIVIHNSDHGGVLPRSKRFLFSSGLHCPLIIRIPEAYKSHWPAEQTGTKIDRLVSFIDMPKTWLSIAGADIPDVMQGTVFLGPQTEPEQPFHYAFRARMDERRENARAVCNKQYLYIRNYMPHVPWMQHLHYLRYMKATDAWVKHVESGQASEVQSRFFAPKNWTEELYDMQSDPDSIHNLIDNPEHREMLGEMRATLRSWQEQIHDAALMPESEVVRRAQANGLTIYEMVRDPSLYNTSALLDAADLALAKDPNHLPALEKLLNHPDCGLRYWGIIGCFLLDHQPAGLQGLEDESHEVRAMAAWLLINTGKKAEGVHCLEDLLSESSYATLSVLNIIDWMGEDGKAFIPALNQLSETGKQETTMQNNLLVKYGLKKAPKR